MGTSWVTATKWTLFLVAMLIFILHGECRPQQDHRISVRSSKKVCGKTLSELVSYICQHPSTVRKREIKKIPDFIKPHRRHRE